MSGFAVKIIASLIVNAEVVPDDKVNQLKSSLNALSTVEAVPSPLPTFITVMISPTE